MKQGALLRQFVVWILLANLLSIGFMTVVGKQALDRSARDTVGRSQQDHLSGMARVLARHYAYHGEWQPVIDNTQLWWTLASPMAMMPNPDGSAADLSDMLKNHTYLHPMLTSESYGGPASLVAKDLHVQPMPSADAGPRDLAPPPASTAVIN
ncbi:hypothetical protein QKW35_17950 [Pontibacterium granulatum]|uniref:hypothetical protein n=1 Tax=Pontibacterium granulatum TaxID=2036029 RepID=UPI00249C5670|nr:hypothetical protein [Pontibacterium granulatum]MDI3326263.1 hypothetical protein [Pontibacterium granulatum]